jgi:hypothetical protein
VDSFEQTVETVETGQTLETEPTAAVEAEAEAVAVEPFICFAAS